LYNVLVGGSRSDQVRVQNSISEGSSLIFSIPSPPPILRKIFAKQLATSEADLFSSKMIYRDVFSSLTHHVLMRGGGESFCNDFVLLHRSSQETPYCICIYVRHCQECLSK
jgi:hypothetical protein